jgi:hypothetical protein
MSFRQRKFGRVRAIDGMHKLRNSRSSGYASISDSMPDTMRARRRRAFRRPHSLDTGTKSEVQGCTSTEGNIGWYCRPP